MGKLIRIGYRKLDELVSESGDTDVLNDIVGRVAEGESLKAIALSMGIPYSVLWAFLSSEDRMSKYRQAQEAAADALAREILSVAESSDVVRDKIDARKWLASKWGRKVYGDKNETDGKVGITVIVQREGIVYE
jgi:hypothetical protein